MCNKPVALIVSGVSRVGKVGFGTPACDWPVFDDRQLITILATPTNLVMGLFKLLIKKTFLTQN